MISIEITRHDDKAQEIIHYNIFAWLGMFLRID